jgi:hypothetical protein
MTFRPYRPDEDRAAVDAIWREVGWIEDDEGAEALGVFLGSGRTVVADLEGRPECVVNTDPGTLRYLDDDIPASCVTGVTTSRIARKRGLASGLTAHALAADAEDGALVAALGAFEQGFYNQLGFGNGSYEHWCTFDPAQLTVDVEPRTPRRLADGDWEAVHRSRLARRRAHGACSVLSPQLTRAEMMWSENGFGLGYADEAGELTHHLWFSAKEVEEGPYRVAWSAYRTRDQFLELLALIRTLADQVRSIRMHEPGGIQLQDLLRKPFRMREITRRSPHEHKLNASAYWQARILDLPACIERTRLDGGPVRFNLALTDPISDWLPAAPWRGIEGDYAVTLGRQSSATRGRAPMLPALRASVGAFTRMWLGVRSATGLSWTDELAGPPDLLADLDRVLSLPVPSSDWDF